MSQRWSGRPDLRRALVAALGAVVALGIGSDLGNVHARALHVKVIALAAAFAVLVLGVAAVRCAAGAVFSAASVRVGKSGASALRLIITLSGYVVVMVTTLGMLAVPVEHLVLGGALTGVVVGIAAQQSLGNVFAGLVLLLARPFAVGDRIRIRAGALGGEFDGTVRAISLTYVTVDTDDGPLHVPNSGVLSAAVGPRPIRRDAALPSSPGEPGTVGDAPPGHSDAPPRHTVAPPWTARHRVRWRP